MQPIAGGRTGRRLMPPFQRAVRHFQRRAGRMQRRGAGNWAGTGLLCPVYHTDVTIQPAEAISSVLPYAPRNSHHRVGTLRSRSVWPSSTHNGHCAFEPARLFTRRPVRQRLRIYNLRGLHPDALSIPTLRPSFPSDMEQTTTSSSFVPLFDTLPSSRTSAASIWAPQPQPSDNTWSKAIDSFSRLNLNGPPPTSGAAFPRPPPLRSSSFPAINNGEDVFGPLGFEMHRRRDVGAIGDGRKRTSPAYDGLVRCTLTSYMRAYIESNALCSTSSRSCARST